MHPKKQQGTEHLTAVISHIPFVSRSTASLAMGNTPSLPFILFHCAAHPLPASPPSQRSAFSSLFGAAFYFLTLIHQKCYLSTMATVNRHIPASFYTLKSSIWGFVLRFSNFTVFPPFTH